MLTPGTDKLVVYVGDYVDRGLESRQVLDLLLGTSRWRTSMRSICSATTMPGCSAS